MNFIDSFAQVGTVVAEISDVLAQPEQRRAERSARLVDASGAPLAPGSSPAIELSDVRFSYGAPTASPGAVPAGAAHQVAEATSDEVIHGVNLRIEAGRVTAFVGPSGSGKSTLARLIAGFWDPDAGTVRIGGAPTTSCSAEQLSRLIAYVSQDNYLFDDTVMENIRMGRPDASDEEVIAAARASGCHDFIMGLDRGYQTVVGGSGGHLSGGERQRVTIARAILKDAPVVILDEATANIDPENEQDIQNAVTELCREKTVIMIAHRLKTVRDADQIVVMDAGRIVQHGTHEELIAQPGIYRDFVQMREKAIGWKLGRQVS